MTKAKKSTSEKLGLIFFIAAIIACIYLYDKSWTAIDLIKGTIPQSISYDNGRISEESLKTLENEISDANKYDDLSIESDEDGNVKITFSQDKVDFPDFVTMCENASADTLSLLDKYDVSLSSVLVRQEEETAYLSWTSDDGLKGTLGYNSDTTGSATENYTYVKGITPEEMRSRLDAGDLFTSVR